MPSPTRKIYQDYTFYLATAFIAGLTLYEKLVLPFKQHDFLEVYRPIQGFSIQVFSYLAVILLVWLAFNARKGPRILVYALFFAATLTEYGYVSAVGRFSIVQDYTMGFQAGDLKLIVNALAAFLGDQWAIIVPLLGFAVALYFTRKLSRFGGKQLLLLLLAITVYFSILSPFSRGTYPTVSFAAGWRTLVFTGVDMATTYHGPRQEVTYRASATPQNNLVFVIDESMRADHLSLNGYARKTTPYLEELEQSGKLINWGISSSSATSSLNANVLLFTGVNRLPDLEQDHQKKPSIFQYAKAMGYETYYLDAQMDRPWLLGLRDMKYVDHLVPVSELNRGVEAWDVDFSAARYAQNLLRTRTGVFIWINKMGAHYPYSVLVPPDKAIWQPVITDLTYDETRKTELINSYDNIIAYNLDQFFAQLIGDQQVLDNTTIVYTSDHGQTLSENGETWPHSGNTRNEASVPLFLLSGQPLQVVNDYRASHMNVFATLLDLMNFPEDQRAYDYAISLLDADLDAPTYRYYLFGTIDSRYGSEVLPFDTD